MFSKSCLLKVLIGMSAFVLLGLAGLYFYYNEAKPDGKTGPEAEQLTQKMLDAINDEAWQEVEYIAWNFADRQQYLWDKKRHLVRVRWADTEVLLDPNEISGIAYVDKKEISGDEGCLLYTSPSPRDKRQSRMPSSA